MTEPIVTAAPEEDLPPSMDVIMCDIDRVIADDSHRRHLSPPEGSPSKMFCPTMDLMHRDTIIYQTLMLLALMHAAGAKIVLFTGRLDEPYRLMTTNWLAYAGVPYDALLMMPEDRDDYVEWKAECVDHPEVGGPERVIMVLDDNPKVLERYKERGVHCLLVMNGVGEGESPLAPTGLYDAIDAEEA